MAPLIGMTEYYSRITEEFVLKNLFNPQFLCAILPGSDVKITDQEGNYMHIQMQVPILNSKIALKEVLIPMETDLILERKDSDAISSNLWDFYVSKNNLFLALSGRIRMKTVHNALKLGIYIEEISPRDPQLQHLSLRELVGFVRGLIRKSIAALQHYTGPLLVKK